MNDTYQNMFPGDMLKTKRGNILRQTDNSSLLINKGFVIFVLSRVDLPIEEDFDDYAQGRFHYLIDGTIYSIVNYLNDSFDMIMDKI